MHDEAVRSGAAGGTFGKFKVQEAMRRRFHQIDVFTTVPYLGNPVAVVLDGDDLSVEQMQAIARWTNLSETTFVCKPTDPRADYRLRIFCTTHEMPFAGHPTIGSAHALLRSGLQPKGDGVLVQECGVGLVQLRTAGDNIRVALPPATFRPVDESLRTELESAVQERFLEPPVIVDLGIVWLTGQLESGERVRRLRPNMAGLGEVARRAGANGVTLFGFEAGGGGVEVRSFAPHEGTPEDPVCGSGNGAVAHVLRKQRGPRDYVARQGCCLGRDGHVHVSYEGDAIWIGGQAVTCIEGTIAA